MAVLVRALLGFTCHDDHHLRAAPGPRGRGHAALRSLLGGAAAPAEAAPRERPPPPEARAKEGEAILFAEHLLLDVHAARGERRGGPARDRRAAADARSRLELVATAPPRRSVAATAVAAGPERGGAAQRGSPLAGTCPQEDGQGDDRPQVTACRVYLQVGGASSTWPLGPERTLVPAPAAAGGGPGGRGRGGRRRRRSGSGDRPGDCGRERQLRIGRGCGPAARHSASWATQIRICRRLRRARRRGSESAPSAGGSIFAAGLGMPRTETHRGGQRTSSCRA